MNRSIESLVRCLYTAAGMYTIVSKYWNNRFVRRNNIPTISVLCVIIVYSALRKNPYDVCVPIYIHHICSSLSTSGTHQLYRRVFFFWSSHSRHTVEISHFSLGGTSTSSHRQTYIRILLFCLAVVDYGALSWLHTRRFERSKITQRVSMRSDVRVFLCKHGIYGCLILSVWNTECVTSFKFIFACSSQLLTNRFKLSIIIIITYTTYTFLAFV